MPYYSKGKCIYKKDTNKKVGCTKGSVKKYMKALHANVKESINECYEYKRVVITDNKTEATVFFALTEVPRTELGLVFSLQPDVDYEYGVIRDLNTNELHRFDDPQKASKLFKDYGLTPEDVENEMYQQAYEHIEGELETSRIDDGVQTESLEFEQLFDAVMNFEKESKI